MILYVNIEAQSPGRGLVISETAPAHIEAPSFVLGDVVDVYLYLVDGKGAFSAIGGEPASSVKVGLGLMGAQPVALGTGWGAVQFGWRGFLDINSLEAHTLVGLSDFVEVFLEIELSRGDGTVTTIVQQRCEIRNELIDATPGGSNPGDSFFSKDEALARFVHNRSELTSLTGGSASALDGIPTLNLAYGVLAAVTFSGVVRFYQLLNSTQAPNPPYYVRPIDYSAATAKTWKLINVDIAGHTHIQVAPDSIWTGVHGFGFVPSGMAVIVGGEMVYGTVFVDDNNYTVQFSANYAGQARMR